MSDLLVTATVTESGGNGIAIAYAAKFGPALSGMIDHNVMVFVSDDPTRRLLACSTQPNAQGQSVWGGASDTGFTASGAPSLAGLLNNLWMAWLANDGSGTIWVASSANGINWQGAAKTGHTSGTAPFMINANGILFIAFVRLDDGEARITSSIDGVNWSNSITTGVKSAFTPAITGFDFQLNFSLA